MHDIRPARPRNAPLEALLQAYPDIHVSSGPDPMTFHVQKRTPQELPKVVAIHVWVNAQKQPLIVLNGGPSEREVGSRTAHPRRTWIKITPQGDNPPSVEITPPKVEAEGEGNVSVDEILDIATKGMEIALAYAKATHVEQVNILAGRLQLPTLWAPKPTVKETVTELIDPTQEYPPQPSGEPTPEQAARIRSMGAASAVLITLEKHGSLIRSTQSTPTA